MASKLRTPTSHSSAVAKHKELADGAHKLISAGLDLEAARGDLTKTITYYLDGIDLLKQAIQMKFSTQAEKDTTTKLNSDMKSNLKKIEDHVKEISAKLPDKKTTNLPPLVGSSRGKPIQGSLSRSSTPSNGTKPPRSVSISLTSTGGSGLKPPSSRPGSVRPSSATRPKSASRKVIPPNSGRRDFTFNTG
jgi:hypothetical protein